MTGILFRVSKRAIAYSAAVPRDTPPDPARNSRVVHRVAAAIGLGLAPAIVFLVYGVEAFYQLSGADPFIYIGYTFSFADLIERWGYPYYAVRFGLIVPNNIFAELFGATAGYLVLRWLLVVASCACVFAAMARRFRTPAAVLVICMLLLSPTFIRAVMTNYSTTVGVPAVGAAFALMLMSGDGWRLVAYRVGAGLAIGLAINSNVFSALPIVALTSVWVWSRWQDRRSLAPEFAWLAAAALAVTAAGYLVYAVRFGDGNLLGPSLTAVDRLSAGQSPDKEPGLEWLNFRPEVWLAPIASLVCGLAIRAAGRKAEWWTRAVAAGPVVAWGGYGLHTFVLGSNTLELYYYSSYMIVPTVMAFGAALSMLVADRRRQGAYVLLGAGALVAIAPSVWTHLGRGLHLWSLNGLLPIAILIATLIALSSAARWAPLVASALVCLLPLATTLASPQNVPNPSGARPRQEPTYPMSIFRYDDRTLDLYGLAADFASSVPRTASEPGSVVFWRPANDYTAVLMQWTYLGPYSSIPDALDPFPALSSEAAQLLRERTPRFLVIVSSLETSVDDGAAAISKLGLEILNRNDLSLTRGPYQLWVTEFELVPDACDLDGQGETTFWSELSTCGS